MPTCATLGRGLAGRALPLAVVALLLCGVASWPSAVSAARPALGPGVPPAAKATPPVEASRDDASRDDEMFGGGDSSEAKAPPAGSPAKPGTTDPTASTPPTAPGAQPSARGPAGPKFGDSRYADAAVTSADTDRLKDKLDIGGMLYLRNTAALTADTAWSRQALSSNNLMDVYFDTRPNDRLRAFVRGRLIYTPVAASQQAGLLTGQLGATSTLNPQLVEMWVKFDIARACYVTIGTQQLRWGTTRLWNPVDVIYATRRNPLTLFDQRVGLPMVKLHFPIDSLGWNAYLLALGERGSNLRNWGVAGRLEMVFSTVELGLTAMKRMDFDPRVGLDWSAGIWELDITGELGVRVDAAGAVHWMLSAGVSYTLEVGDDDLIIFGAEYFHNPEGFSDAQGAADQLIAWSVQSQIDPDKAGPMPLAFFYTGKHYAALFAVAMGPGSWDDTSFTLSAIGNLSDGTGFVQVLASTKILQDLSLEGFVAANVGGDGEFRFYSGYLNEAINKQLGGAASVQIPKPVGQLGVNLRMSF